MSASEFTVTDLRRLLRTAAGAGEEMGSDTTILDATFENLGFESLALLETSALIQREFGVRLDESALDETLTPRGLIDSVNAKLALIEAL
jgi:act minimal PKS acyl carrier protein